MSDKTFEVVFRGRVLKGYETADVKKKLAALFKINEATAEKLFSGKRVTVKKGLDEATARKYRDVLRSAGANASIVTVGAGGNAPKAASKPAAESASAAPGEDPSAGEDGTWVLDPVGTVLAQADKPDSPQIDVSGMSIAEVGTVFDTPAIAEAPQFNFSEFTVDDPGQTIVEPEVVEDAEFDLSGLSAGEPGEVLPQPEAVPPAEIDTEGLAMAEAGSQLIEKEAVTPAEIATDHLTLEPAPQPEAQENPFLSDSEN